ncbi:MAG: hypothetical protein HN884_17050 [Rhodospirillaceae bacterium]|jgi:uncharacterized protein|nr:hypothetical protein [Rhodospirillaceae bacterium]MBT7268587.1 hypothetical protein [Rhodospirillaceae bacterium]
MQFLAWGTHKQDIMEKRAALQKDHWAFWDDYEDRLIARGPLLNSDGSGPPTGNIHIITLNDWDEAKIIVTEEPYTKAGLFQDMVLTQFFLELDRTQFDSTGLPDRQGYFIYCPAADRVLEQQVKLASAHQDYCQSKDDIFACRGSILSDAGDWNGTAFLVEVSDEDAVTAFLEEEPYNAAGLFEEPRITRWRRGGRPKT